ncbi:putative polyvalent protein kinase domain-containing protein [Flavobacterium sp. WC2509]|uniref:putative polyvalent protein kinase domain-containing protein n=1 Tax=Flavobacterium sp. WC2509 TaxID=3461406 RepID=UPI004043E60B
MKHELQNIISGKSQVRHGDAIQAVANYLRRSKSASCEAKGSKQIKSEEAENIKQFCNQNNFWKTNIDINSFVSSGAEQKVYLHQDEFQVLKLNDSIYYSSWEDYFNNLLLNNFFFPDTAYQLVGFYESEEILYAVVEQDFIKFDELTQLENVKKFLNENGFKNTRNNDYFNPDLGIILEDLHDENVLTFQSNLYFIDTVFYITDEFYKL